MVEGKKQFKKWYSMINMETTQKSKQQNQQQTKPYYYKADSNSLHISQLQDDYQKALDQSNYEDLDHILRVSKPTLNEEKYVMPIMQKIIDNNDHELFAVLEKNYNQFAPGYEKDYFRGWGVQHDDKNAIYKIDDLIGITPDIIFQCVKNKAFNALDGALDVIGTDAVPTIRCIECMSDWNEEEFDQVRLCFQDHNIDFMDVKDRSAKTNLLKHAAIRNRPDLLNEMLNRDVFDGYSLPTHRCESAVARIACNWEKQYKRLLTQLGIGPRDDSAYGYQELSSTIIKQLLDNQNILTVEDVQFYENNGVLTLDGYLNSYKAIVENATPECARYIISNSKSEIAAKDLYDLLLETKVPDKTLDNILDAIDYTPTGNVQKRMIMASAEGGKANIMSTLLNRFNRDLPLYTTPHNKTGNETSILHRALTRGNYDCADWVASQLDEFDDDVIEYAFNRLIPSYKTDDPEPKSFKVLLRNGLEIQNLNSDRKEKIKNNNRALHAIRGNLDESTYAALAI